jgi:type VI secretion system protein ImpB
VEIDPDNFNQVLAGMKPRLAYTTLTINCRTTAAKWGSSLSLRILKTLSRTRVIQQVEPLRKLVEARKKLSDLRSKMDGNEKLESMLEDIISNSDKQKELSQALGVEGKEE